MFVGIIRYQAIRNQWPDTGGAYVLPFRSGAHTERCDRKPFQCHFFYLLFMLRSLDLSLLSLSTLLIALSISTSVPILQESAGEDIPIMLLGNKTDKETERQVQQEVGQRLAKVSS